MIDPKLLNTIPQELKEKKQWVGVSGENKVPMQLKRDNYTKLASTTNPETWASFSEALLSITEERYNNIGFVFADNGIVGIDIDIGYDEDGLLSQTACDIIGVCESYTEKSRSGRGFHVLVKGKLPFKGRNNLHGVEIYQDARYFIMTGDILLYRDMQDNQDAIDYILQKYFSDVRESHADEHMTGRIYNPQWELPENGRIKLRPVYPRIPQGSRNICLTSLAGMLHSMGYTSPQIYDELRYCNTVACDPPVTVNELKAICKSVSRYKR